MDPLAPLVAALRAEGRPRVWSLVITAFGDLVQHRGGAVTTARLNVLMRRIGVEAGTLRTALSRLDSDGWVERERDGRSSVCRLSRQGWEQFGPATSTIYAPPRRGPVTRWRLSVCLGETGAAGMRLTPAEQPAAPADAAVSGTLEALSPACRAAFLDPSYRAALEALARDLEAVPGIADPLDAAAARLLLIHRWRRIVLRFPEPLPDLLPEDSPLDHPRDAVARAYARLWEAAEAWLGMPVAGGPGMPPADAEFAKRFGMSLQA